MDRRRIKELRKMSKKENYEHLLYRIEELENRVNILEFLKDYDADDVALGFEIDNDDKGNEVSWYAKFLNYDGDRLIQLFILSHGMNKLGRTDIRVVSHGDMPFKFIEVRSDGVLSCAYKVDYFLERLWAQDLPTYTRQYEVNINTGGKKKNGYRSNKKRTDDD